MLELDYLPDNHGYRNGTWIFCKIQNSLADFVLDSSVVVVYFVHVILVEFRFITRVFIITKKIIL